MSKRSDMKIYTLRHWLFYAGVIVVLGLSIGTGWSIFNWSYGVTFAMGAIAGIVTCMMALREDLFGPVPVQREQRDRRA